jgi:hypothetical protein
MSSSVNDIAPITDAWTIGKRVTRPNGSDSGTIVECGIKIKVKWDGGRTSYFERGKVPYALLDECASPGIGK